jgi:hypothetical protein
VLVTKLIKLRVDQKQFMEGLPGSASEHIRRAIDDYIDKTKKSRINVSKSPSKIVKGGNNGREQPDTKYQPTTTPGG